MRTISCSIILLSLCSLPTSSQNAAYRKVVVEAVVVSGVQSLDSMQLSEITNPLAQSIVNEDPKEIAERLRIAFQNAGYFDAKIQSVRIHSRDPLARPKPITVEAEVTEGELFRIGEITFSGNHAISSDKLRAEFPFRKGQVFRRGKVASGLEAILRSYDKLGHIETTVLPEVTKGAGATIDLLMKVEEGHQYRMGALKFEGDSQAAEQLRSRWEMESGQPFVLRYVEKFLKNNESLLPSEFDLSQVKFARDCRERTVTVFMNLDAKRHSPGPEEVGCEDSNVEGSSR